MRERKGTPYPGNQSPCTQNPEHTYHPARTTLLPTVLTFLAVWLLLLLAFVAVMARHRKVPHPPLEHPLPHDRAA